jgi:hypothetical protein
MKKIFNRKKGGRQHCLRWETPTITHNCETAGRVNESTLSFADHTGFRYGTCYEYPFYDVSERYVMKIHIRPLIVMECSVLSDGYMNYDAEAAMATFNSLKAK